MFPSEDGGDCVVFGGKEGGGVRCVAVKNVESVATGGYGAYILIGFEGGEGGWMPIGGCRSGFIGYIGHAGITG